MYKSIVINTGETESNISFNLLPPISSKSKTYIILIFCSMVEFQEILDLVLTLPLAFLWPSIEPVSSFVFYWGLTLVCITSGIKLLVEHLIMKWKAVPKVLKIAMIDWETLHVSIPI